MKKQKTILFFGALSILLFSCSAAADENSNSTEAVETEVSDAQSEAAIVEEETTVDYAADWNAFKKAIQEKDEEALKARSTNNIKDFTAILFMCTEIYVLEKLDETTFEKLELPEVDEDFQYKFYAEDIGIDEFGYEYGTAITLYFITTDEGLFLNAYSAAG